MKQTKNGSQTQILLFFGKKKYQKYENVQKGVGDMMRGALIETSARTILKQGIKQGIDQGIIQGKSQGITQNQRETALRMLKKGKMTNEEIAEYTRLSIMEVEQLAGLQTV